MINLMLKHILFQFFVSKFMVLSFFTIFFYILLVYQIHKTKTTDMGEKRRLVCINGRLYFCLFFEENNEEMCLIVIIRGDYKDVSLKNLN